MMEKKTDLYAVFLLVAAAFLVAGGVVTGNLYKKMKAAESRQAIAKKYWEDALALEKQIRSYPQKEVAAGGTITLQEVNDAITGAPNKIVQEKGIKEPLKDRFHLDINFVARRTGTIREAWTFETLPIKVNQGRMEDLGMLVSVIETFFPQARTTLINYTRPAEKQEGNGTVEITIYSEKEP